MPVIISLPDDIAKKLQTEADARQLSINQLAVDFLEKALGDESFDTQSDFKMLGTQMRATPHAIPALLSKEPSETKVDHNDDTSDFEKIGDKIKGSPPREVASKGAGDGAGDGAKLSSASSLSSPDEDQDNEDNLQNRSDTSSVSTSFKKVGTQLRGKPAAIASTGWLLDPSVSPINDHKYRVDLEQWSSLWGKVKVDMKYEQPSLI